MTYPIGTEHRCQLARFAACTGPTSGRPTRKKCPGCGADFIVSQGTYAVIAWRGDDRYRVEDAVATYARYSAAERRSKEDERLVVRFLPVPAAPAADA